VAAGVVVAGGALATLPDGLIHSLGEPGRRGSLDDVEHVVILMQENRSFDHYYGTLPGVRGYADTAILPGVFEQPNPKGGAVLPFHVDTQLVDGQRLIDLDHSWDGTHAAWAGGGYDGWVGAKTAFTMGHFTAEDVPFHHALADAFTVCDHYFCSLLGPTTPNRLHLFTGTIDPEGRAGGPAIANPDNYKPVYRWTTYPERLQAAGVSWRVYANNEVGDGENEDGYVGDYGDNPLWLFQAYHDSLASPDPAARELARRGSVHGAWQPNSGQGHDVNHVLADFIADCRAGTLPRVSWVVAPYAYCEHPRARPVDGARYVSAVLAALFGNTALWESTAVFLNYDENDGFFDHVPPPVAPPGTPLEYVGGRPIGLGPRVPMTVISPWSRGGWVNSEVHDHTSVIRFLERWTGVREPNISQWRRSVTGDLTGCFDFREHDPSIPTLPDTAALQEAVDRRQASLPPPAVPPADQQRLPVQPPGPRPARAVPYQPLSDATLDGDTLTVRLGNQGTRPVQLAVYSSGEPTAHLVQPSATAALPLPVTGGGYRVTVLGPNGFLRRFQGGIGDGAVDVSFALAGPANRPALRWTATNSDATPVRLLVSDALEGRPARAVTLGIGGTHTEDFDPIGSASGWYDLSFAVDGDPAYLRRFAGHLEDGNPSHTHPGEPAATR
jgi:phospholipase C